MKKIIISIFVLTISFTHTFGQDYGIGSVTSDDLFSGGNVILRKLMKRDYSEAEGSPYLNDQFTKGKIIFNNGKVYDVLTRLNVGTQKFEIKKNINSPASLIEIDETVTVQMNNKKYNLHSISLENEQILAILEDCIELENISLYYFPRKVIKMPVETGAAAPSTGFTKVPKPKWADASKFLILKELRQFEKLSSIK